MRHSLHAHSSNRRARLGVEALEDRLVLSATVTLNSPASAVIGTNVNLSNNPSLLASQVALDVNPTNPLNLVAVSVDAANPDRIEVDSSRDDGRTWTRTFIDDRATGFADGFGPLLRVAPTVKFDGNGNLYVAYGIQQGTDPSSASTHTWLEVARSQDGGSTFNQVTRVVDQAAQHGFVDGRSGIGLEGWHLATGLDPSSGNQVVYVAFIERDTQAGSLDEQVRVSGSRDGGVSFTAPQTVNDDSLHWYTAGLQANRDPSPAVGPNGQLDVCWLNVPLPGHGPATVKLDTDATGLWANGNHFGNDVVVQQLQQVSHAQSVSSDPGVGFFTHPVLAVDRSAGSAGRIYLAFADGPSPTSTDVFLTSSLDGTTWTALGSVGNVENEPGADFLPSLAVDPVNGGVQIGYFSSAGDQSSSTVNARLASSFDGGVSFTRVNLSSAASVVSATGPITSGKSLGLAAWGSQVHAVWTDQRGGMANPQEFTTTATFLNTLTVTADDSGPAGDTIVLRLDPANPAFVQVLVDGSVQYRGLAAIFNRIVLDCGAKNDTINVEAIPAGIAVTANGGAGNDAFLVSPTAASLGTLSGSLTINGGTGTDSLNISDENGVSFFAPSYTITSGAVSSTVSSLAASGTRVTVRTLTTTIPYTRIATLVVNTSNQGSAVDVESTSATTIVRASGNGHNTFVVSQQAQNLNNLAAGLTFVGNGTSTLTVDDQANPYPFSGSVPSSLYSVSATTVSRPRGALLLPQFNVAVPLFASINYFGMASLVVNSGGGNDTLTVGLGSSTSLLPAFQFNGGAGSNTLIINGSSTNNTVYLTQPPGTSATGPAQVTAAPMGPNQIASRQVMSYVNVAGLWINNAAAVNAEAGPDTADRTAAFAGLNAPERAVQALFLDAQGRAVSKAVLDSWVSKLPARATSLTPAVIAGIEHTQPALDHLVKSWYIAYLGRQAAGGEEQSLVNLLVAGHSEEQVLSLLLGDPVRQEFFNRAQGLVGSGTPVQRFVTALYQLLLGRAPSSSDLTAGVSRVAALGRQGFSLWMLQKGEFRTDQFEGYYNALLHRPSMPSDQPFLGNEIASTTDMRGVRLLLERSLTFFANG